MVGAATGVHSTASFRRVELNGASRPACRQAKAPTEPDLQDGQRKRRDFTIAIDVAVSRDCRTLTVAPDIQV